MVRTPREFWGQLPWLPDDGSAVARANGRGWRHDDRATPQLASWRSTSGDEQEQYEEGHGGGPSLPRHIAQALSDTSASAAFIQFQADKAHRVDVELNIKINEMYFFSLQFGFRPTMPATWNEQDDGDFAAELKEVKRLLEGPRA